MLKLSIIAHGKFFLNVPRGRALAYVPLSTASPVKLTREIEVSAQHCSGESGTSFNATVLKQASHWGHIAPSKWKLTRTWRGIPHAAPLNHSVISELPLRATMQGSMRPQITHAQETGDRRCCVCCGKEERKTAKPDMEIWEVWKREVLHWGAHVWSAIWNAPDYITSKWSAGMNVIVAQALECDVVKKKMFSYTELSWTLSKAFVSNTAMRKQM